MTKKRKGITLITAILAVTFIVIIFFTNREETQQFMIEMNKYHFANRLQFGFRIVDVGLNITFTDSHNVLMRIRPGADFYDPFYTELVFVRNRAEAEKLPDNVIAAWPRVGGGEAAVIELHEAVNRTEDDLAGLGARPPITLEQFGLAYPLSNKPTSRQTWVYLMLAVMLIKNQEQNVHPMINTTKSLDDANSTMVSLIEN